MTPLGFAFVIFTVGAVIITYISVKQSYEEEIKRLAREFQERETYLLHQYNMMNQLYTNKLKFSSDVVTKLQIANSKVRKLKKLMLLTDDVVGNVAVGETQITQWNEYIKCFPEDASLEPYEKTHGFDQAMPASDKEKMQ